LTAIDSVVAATTVQAAVLTIADDRVCAGAAPDVVRAIDVVCFDEVVEGIILSGFGCGLQIDDHAIGFIPVVDPVDCGSAAALEQIVARPAAQCVIAGISIDSIGPGAADQHVVSTAATDGDSGLRCRHAGLNGDRVIAAFAEDRYLPRNCRICTKLRNTTVDVISLPPSLKTSSPPPLTSTVRVSATLSPVTVMSSPTTLQVLSNLRGSICCTTGRTAGKKSCCL
jgi:hypothetical protein